MIVLCFLYFVGATAAIYSMLGGAFTNRGRTIQPRIRDYQGDEEKE